MIRNTCFFLLILLTMIFMGCSTSNPVLPGRNQPQSDDTVQAVTDLTGDLYQIWMKGTMVIDPSTPDGIVLIDRLSDWNVNITGLLASACPGGCFRFRILDIVGTVLEIELTLENPTNIQVYDVRLIYENTYGKTVVNPDSYTNMFKPLIIRPFTGFAKQNIDRAFPVGPGAIDTETLFLDFPSSAPANVDYIIVASLPDQTGDPFEINTMVQDGELIPTGGLSEISVYALDHQDDVTSVTVDTSALTGGITNLVPDSIIQYRWIAEITNSEGAPAGSYPCLVTAVSPNQQNVTTYHYFEIAVTSTFEWGSIEEVHLSPEGWYSIDPDLAYDSEGYAHICWTEVENVGYMEWTENIWYSNNTAGYWSAPYEVSDAFQNVNDYIVSPSVIAINNQDKICIIWTQELFNGDRPKLWWNLYDGANWMGQTQMFDLTNQEVMPQLCSSDHFLYLAFRHGYQSPELMFSKWDTTKWTAPVCVNDPIDMVFEIEMSGKSSITAASRGGLFITWTFFDMNPDGKWRVQYDESWDGGVTWGPDMTTICDDPTLPMWDPSIAMDGGGNLYELWRIGYDQIRWDKNTHGGWGTDKILYGKNGGIYPAFDVMPGGYQHVCYINSKAFPVIPLLYIESQDGELWSNPMQISPDEGECEMPSVKVWGGSKVGVTWKQHLEHYSNDILFREKRM
jgi:hypothetical protein